MNTYLDGRPAAPARRSSRFLVFGLIVILGVGALTARLFYLQIATGSEYAALSTSNRTVLEPITSPRGLIYDRNGRLLVTNVPTYAVKIRPADLPNSRRDDVVARLGALLTLDPAEINGSIDGNPGSAFDLVRIAQDVDKSTALLISEAGAELPGVEVAIEARRQYTDGPLMSQLLGYTAPVSAEQLPDLRTIGYQPDDLLGKVGLELKYEKNLRELVTQMKATNAKLIWCSTTPVPDGASIRNKEDGPKYNAVAKKIMDEMKVPTDDLYEFALPQLDKIQLTKNVHFSPGGSEVLAQQVVKSIEQHLPKK